jgi:hypothetical protein
MPNENKSKTDNICKSYVYERKLRRYLGEIDINTEVKLEGLDFHQLEEAYNLIGSLQKEDLINHIMKFPLNRSKYKPKFNIP